MPFGTSLSLVLDAKQSVELLFGGAVQVWNLFSKNRLQPAAAVYFANCALYGGDSDGWRESLQSFSVIRSTRGFQISGDRCLSIGFPGADILPALLETEYGSRWLGLLSVLATIRDEHHGAVNLEQFVRKTASDPTRKFVLDLETCERLWTLSREMFAGSPYWYNFLEITSSILVHCKVPETDEAARDLDLLNHIFPNPASLSSGQFLTITMTAAFDLWHLSKKPESKGKSLWARGSTGCAQLIFYLTVVCGFFVRLGIGDGNSTFGDQNSGQAEITIEIVLRDVQRPWEIGYLLENYPMDRSVRSILPTLANDDTWRLRLVPDTERSNSKYRVEKNTCSLEAGRCLSPILNAVRKEIASHELVFYVSHWFSDVLLYYMLHYDLRAKETSLDYDPPPIVAARSERLGKAIELFAPGILTYKDQKELIKKVREHWKPDLSIDRLSMSDPARNLCCRLPPHTAILLPDCPLHGSKNDETSFCRFRYITETLEEAATSIWIGTYIATNPEYLRDISTHQPVSLHSACFSQRGRITGIFRTFSLDEVLRGIAGRLAGCSVERIENCVGRVAGGFVIGVFGNEDLAISQDQGHSIYIEPGGISTQERHYKRVVQSTEVKPIQHPTETKSGFIYDFTVPQDCFSGAVLKQNVQINGDTATLESLVYQNQRRLYKLDPRIAIDRSSTIRISRSCLRECLKGKLTGLDLLQVVVDLPDKTHYTSAFGVQQNTQFDEKSERDALSGRKGRLTVFPAHGNVLVQRAIISQPALDKVAILTGTCVHCAIKQSLEEGMQALIC